MAIGSPFYITLPQLEPLIARFAAFSDTYASVMAKTLEKAAIQTQSTLMSQVPVRSGRLRQSIGYIVKGSTSAVVSVDPKLLYAGAVEYGSGVRGTGGGANDGNPIVPKNAAVMATKINPGWGTANAQGYFIIGTQQQGQAPNPFMVRTKAIAFPIVQLTFAEAGKLLTASLGD